MFHYSTLSPDVVSASLNTTCAWFQLPPPETSHSFQGGKMPLMLTSRLSIHSLSKCLPCAVTVFAAAILVCQYLLAVSGDPLAKIVPFSSHLEMSAVHSQKTANLGCSRHLASCPCAESNSQLSID